MRSRFLMLSLAALLAAFVAAGCGDKTVTEAPPTVTTQTSPEKHDSESGNNAPAASTLGIQENPNGTNPGMGSR